MTDYYNTASSVDEYIKLAKDVNGLELIAQMKAILPIGSDVLEIGTGPGTDWKILNEDYTVVGSDNSTEFLNRLIANNPSGDFLKLDAITLITEKKFDGIYANKVLHHLRNDELAKSVSAQFNLLNPKGIVCLSFWKGKGDEVYNGMYVNYHEAADLESFFKDSFDIISLQPYKEFEENDSLLLLARRKDFLVK